MLIWFDVNTTKHALLFGAMVDKFSKKGYKTLLTAREYDAIIGTLNRMNQEYVLVGEYGGKTLMGKLYASVKKTLNIVKYFDENGITPDYAVFFGSPEASRVSFGLGIKSICVNDTPHSIYPIKLVIPLTDYLILPKAVPKTYYYPYISGDRVIQFYGVDAIEWIDVIHPDFNVLRRLGIEKGDRYVVFRPEEVFASYYLSYSKGEPLQLGLKILKYILENFKDHKVIVLARYREQKKFIEKGKSDRIIIPRETVLGLDLYKGADLVITGGETMALESSLLGIPALTYFPMILHPSFFLRSLGFPIEHETRLDRIKEIISKILLNPDDFKVDTESWLNEFEKPSDKILEILEKDGQL